MAWTKVYYDTKRQDQIQSTADDKGMVTEQVIQTWIAVSDSQADTPLTAQYASAGGNTIPIINGLYTLAGQPGFICNSRIPKRASESPFVYEIQVQFQRKYSPPTGSSDKWNIDISIKGSKFQQAAYQDMDDNDIINAAGQAFTDPGLIETFYDESIEISFNTLSADSSVFAGLRGKCCSGACSFNIKGMNRSFTARQLLCEDASMSTSLLSGSDFSTPVWKATISLLYREDGFTDNVLQQGYTQLNAAGKQVAILDANGVPISSPARLDNDGHVITDPTADGVYKEVKIVKEADLSPLFSGLY